MTDVNGSNIKRVAFSYTTLLGIPITRKTLQNKIAENPYYPSLLSLTDTFSKFKIENAAYHIDANKIDEVYPPYIAYLSLSDSISDFVLITDINNNVVHYKYRSNKKHLLSKEKFIKSFKNIVVLAQPTVYSGEKDYQLLRGREIGSLVMKLISVLAILFFLLYIYFENFAAVSRGLVSFIYIEKILGAAFTSMLLYVSINQNDNLFQSVCSGNKKVNCNAVLGSKASKIFGISWSEIGLLYFLSTFIFLIFKNVPIDTRIDLLIAFNFITVPYSFFSFYYQGFVVKQWCVFCIIVQFLLVSECIWAIVNLNFILSELELSEILNEKVVFPLLISFTIPMVLWYILRPILIKANKFDSESYELKRIKNNPSVFRAILHQNQEIKSGWQSLGINLGNPLGAITIVKICNPFCGPCAIAHEELENLLNKVPSLFLKIIFLVSDNEDSPDHRVATHLLKISKHLDSRSILSFLNDWYTFGRLDFESFLKRSLLVNQNVSVTAEITEMSTWCKTSELYDTPAIFIDGYKLPSEYSISKLIDILR